MHKYVSCDNGYLNMETTKANRTQKLPCTFELEVPGLGILEGNPGEDVCILIPRLTLQLANLYPDQSRNPD